jgi:CBS domain containing-hemolysin-like protein
MGEAAAAVWLGVALTLDLLIALGGSGLKNSHLSHLDQMRGEGRAGAALAHRVASSATELILATRLTQTALRLAVVGLALTVSAPALPPLGSSAAPVLVLLVSGLGLFALEFLLENLAIRRPEVWASRLAALIALIVIVEKPLIALALRLASRAANAPAGRKHPLVTEEEIMTLVDASEEGGVIEEEEKEMIYSIFQLGDTLAREIMVPRIDIVAFDERTNLVEASEVLVRTGHSRAPVYRGTIDNIIGVIYVKDLLSAWRGGRQDQGVGQLVREAHFVPEAVRVRDLLTAMQEKRVQLAIVVDEYGGTAGIVSIEDIVEEIVGEIRDEHDTSEEAPVQRLPGGEFLFSGRVNLGEVNEVTGADLPTDTSETLGGFLSGHLGRLPAPGEEVVAGGLRLVVEQVSGRRIRRVRAIPAETRPAGRGGKPGLVPAREAQAKGASRGAKRGSAG